MVFKELEIGDLLPTLVKPNQLTVALVRGNSTDMNQFVNSIKKQLKRQITSAVNQLLSHLTTTWLLSKICTMNCYRHCHRLRLLSGTVPVPVQGTEQW